MGGIGTWKMSPWTAGSPVGPKFAALTESPNESFES
jgi:hypothetical protein